MTGDFDPLIDELPARYVVGIDLGTTNSAVAYVDTDQASWSVQTFRIPQLTAPGVIEDRDTLPSFHYEAAEGEATGDTFRLPWHDAARSNTVGVFARDQGIKTPGRLIASTKSWLCHTGVDRTADLLPWHGAADVERLSPVEASARILLHVRDAWDARFPKHPLSEQDIVLTLPASFDEIARELTVQAAAAAELPRVVLLEEPQAAFYAWVYRHRDQWQTRVKPGQTILVCDVGGGTSDFTLIRVRAGASRADDGNGKEQSPERQSPEQQSPEQQSPEQQSPEQGIQFHRIAVGNHLILGGDNLDLALARHLEQKLTEGGRLPSHQWDVLVRTCQRVKEELLGAEAPDRLTVNLPGSGSRLISGAVQVEVTRDEAQSLLVDGFLPRVAIDDKPSVHQSGFQEFGLPYASDPAITRYLGSFLRAHRFDEVERAAHTEEAEELRPDIVLLNGGFFASPALRERLIDIIANWYRRDEQDPWTPQVLDHDRLDLAVAHGAAYYGMVRRGKGVKIVANLARSYYIGIESESPTAVCLVPGSAEPGQDIVLQDRTFQLLVSEPVEFPLFVSSTRLTDRPGDLVKIDREQMTPLPPMRTVLQARSRKERGTLPVQLYARLNEIGTIDLWCSAVDRDRRWRLQFDIRSTTQTDLEAHQSQAEAEGVADEQTCDAARRLIADVFDKSGRARPESLVRQLAKALQMHKNQWPTPLLRRIWEMLMEFEAGRRKSADHETRWVNLLGFSLRPGYGLAADDWRVAETWRTLQGKLAHAQAAVRNEATVLWRRVAGGLSRGQQQALADPLLAAARNLHHRMTTGRSRGDDAAMRPHELTETWRLLGSLELLDIPRKIELGNMLVELIPKRKLQKVRGPMIWALGRLGQRAPLYGPLNTVIPSEMVEQWLPTLWKYSRDEAIGPIAIMQLARRTDDRYRDVAPKYRTEAIEWLEDHSAAEHLIELVRDGGQLDSGEQREVFGESLPKGLRLE